MNRNQAKQLLPIIQAYAEGKAIESRCIKGDTSLWYDDKDPSFDDDFEYRIKPESTYRPFANAEECWQEMLKHKPFGWLKHTKDGSYSLITNISDLDSAVNDYTWQTNEMMSSFTFADGTPLGVKTKE